MSIREALTFFAAPLNIDPNTVGIPAVQGTESVITQGVKAALIVVGAMSIFFLLVGAFRYTISNGDQSQIKQAKDTILYSLVGAITSALAFTIVQFVLGRVIQ